MKGKIVSLCGQGYNKKSVCKKGMVINDYELSFITHKIVYKMKFLIELCLSH